MEFRYGDKAKTKWTALLLVWSNSRTKRRILANYDIAGQGQTAKGFGSWSKPDSVSLE